MLYKLLPSLLSCVLVFSLTHDVKASNPNEDEKSSHSGKRNKVPEGYRAPHASLAPTDILQGSDFLQRLKALEQTQGLENSNEIPEGTRAPHTSFEPGIIADALEEEEKPKTPKRKKAPKKVGENNLEPFQPFDTLRAEELLGALDALKTKDSASQSPSSSSPAKKRREKPSDEAGKTSPSAKKSGKKSAPKQAPRSRAPATYDVPEDALQTASSAPQALPTSSQEDALDLLLPSSSVPTKRREITTLDVATVMPSSSASAGKSNLDNKIELYWEATKDYHPQITIKPSSSGKIFIPQEFYPVHIVTALAAGTKQVKRIDPHTHKEKTVTKYKKRYIRELGMVIDFRAMQKGTLASLLEVLQFEEFLKDPQMQDFLQHQASMREDREINESDIKTYQTHFGRTMLELQKKHWKLTGIRLERDEADLKASTLGEGFDSNLGSYVFWKYRKSDKGPIIREEIPNLTAMFSFSALKK